MVPRFDLQLHTRSEDDLTRDELIGWCGAGSAPRVSIHLPTHAGSDQASQDRTRFRRLVTLAARDVDDPGVLDVAHDLCEQSDFWAHGTAGLTVLADRSGTTAVRLTQSAPELVVVGDRFHLKPLVAAMNRGVAFDVLALSRHAARLVRGTGTAAIEQEVPGLPAGLADALKWDDRERQLHSHASSRTGSGDVAAAFHGQGGRGDTSHADLDRYLHQVDAAVRDHRGATSRPLVLAGVDDIRSAYRSITRCRDVVDGDIAGNPDRLTAAELAARARSIVEPSTARAEQAARDAFLAGRATTLDLVESSVIAAARGRVSSIFVPADHSIWGRFDPDAGLQAEHDERQPGDHDLTDVAATETLRRGGDAYVVPAREIPRGGTVAATLRW